MHDSGCLLKCSVDEGRTRVRTPPNTGREGLYYRCTQIHEYPCFTVSNYPSYMSFLPCVGSLLPRDAQSSWPTATNVSRPGIGEARRPSLLGKITDSLRAWKPFDLESIVWRNIGFSCALTSKYGFSTVAAYLEVISLASRDCEQPTTLRFLSCKWVFIRIRDRPFSCF